MSDRIAELVKKAIPSIAEGNCALDAEDCGEPLVDITGAHPRIVYDATYHKWGIAHAMTRCYVRQGVYERLLKALALLPDEYGFLIYDTLRPLAVQQALFDEYYGRLAAQHPELSHEELVRRTSEFVARPTKDRLRPSTHQSGGAVDLTLTFGGEPLDMGTAFDEFAPIAHADYFECIGDNPAVRDNRRILHNVMRAAGFTHYPGEWWHFDYGDRMWAGFAGVRPLYAYCADIE